MAVLGYKTFFPMFDVDFLSDSLVSQEPELRGQTRTQHPPPNRPQRTRPAGVSAHAQAPFLFLSHSVSVSPPSSSLCVPRPSPPPATPPSSPPAPPLALRDRRRRRCFRLCALRSAASGLSAPGAALHDQRYASGRLKEFAPAHGVRGGGWDDQGKRSRGAAEPAGRLPVRLCPGEAEM